MLEGITLIRNGNHLKYPWKECIKQLSLCCNQVIVNCGDSFDNTFEDLKALSFELDNVTPICERWDMKNTGNGYELARQINLELSLTALPWVLYLQADEFIHEQDIDKLRSLLDTLPNNITQIELYRTYFWGWDYRAPKYELYLGRVFRKGTHLVGGDGMYLIRQTGDIYRTDIPIYHYSRVGTEEEITRRVRNLDTLFHDQKEIDTFKPIRYTDLRQEELIPFQGTHPKYIKEMLDG